MTHHRYRSLDLYTDDVVRKYANRQPGVEMYAESYAEPTWCLYSCGHSSTPLTLP